MEASQKLSVGLHPQNQRVLQHNPPSKRTAEKSSKVRCVRYGGNNSSIGFFSRSTLGRSGSVGRRAINDFEHRLSGSDQLSRSGLKSLNLLRRWPSLSAVHLLKFEYNRVKRRARFLFRLQD
jgi:hypothetical protein